MVSVASIWTNLSFPNLMKLFNHTTIQNIAVHIKTTFFFLQHIQKSLPLTSIITVGVSDQYNCYSSKQLGEKVVISLPYLSNFVTTYCGDGHKIWESTDKSCCLWANVHLSWPNCKVYWSIQKAIKNFTSLL
jgi:hypothetical protein